MTQGAKELCPSCQMPTHELPGVTAESNVIWHRCSECGFVWATEKPDTMPQVSFFPDRIENMPDDNEA